MQKLKSKQQNTTHQLPHILFISTHNLASNPRLVKEMQLALDNGFTVEVICFRFRNWSYAINHRLLDSFRARAVKFHCIEAGKEGGMGWFFSVLYEKYYRLAARIYKLKGYKLAMAVSRRNYLLIKALKKIKQADRVIGHNPGALYATAFAAKKLKASAGFDVEDYHPGEGHDIFLQGLTRQFMQELLPAMHYVSFAAPLIREAVKNDAGMEGSNWITVMNYFPATDFVVPKNIEGPLQLVWFSQNIAAGRGLEYILPAFKNFKGQIELHLYGHLDESFYETHVKGIENVILHKPVPQKELHNMLSSYDVGLALEIQADRNRDICITNKILAYLQAGLFVLATNTRAQKQLLNSLAGHGFITELETRAFENTLQELLDKKEDIRFEARNRFEKIKKMCWEEEAKGLLNYMQQSN